MGKRKFITQWLMLCFLLSHYLTQAQEQTVGLFFNDSEAFNGYTLFAPIRYTTTYLIDNDGRLVHSWESDYHPGQSVYLLENGHLLRTAKVDDHYRFNAGGYGGRVQEFTWDGTLMWEYVYADSLVIQHHDIEPLPNGNVLLIAWECKTVAEAIAAGRDTSLLNDDELWPDHIVEVEAYGISDGTIVWEWHIWDHLIQDYDSTKANYGVVADHPELLDINFVAPRGAAHGGADWNHMNSIDYHPELDQILVSVHAMSEIYIIDHSTTTEEAAGHAGGRSGKGGDILYRWGNLQAYRAGDASDQKYFRQHDARWIEKDLPGAGNILVFNNGRNRPDGNYSSIDEITPPVDENGHYMLLPGSAYGPAEQIWNYLAEQKTDFYSPNNSGVQRLANGNTLICSGSNGHFFEVTQGKKIVWDYINPVTDKGPVMQGEPVIVGPNKDKHINPVFHITRYTGEFPGLVDKDLTPGDPVEKYPTGIDKPNENNASRFSLNQNFPNPFNPSTAIDYHLSAFSDVELSVFNMRGQKVRILVDDNKPAGNYSVVWDGKDDLGNPVSSGIYFYRLEADHSILTMKCLLLE